MANYNGSLEAVDRHIHSVRYDMVLESRAGGHLGCFYTIMANYNGSLEAVDRHIHSVKYDMVLESRAGGRLRYLIRTPTTL
eukprot:scaffold14215_cov111-Skeletonema_dohrnii-CCMP3373.AAC.1